MGSTLKIWWHVIRPKTLTAAIAPVLVSTALSFSLQENIQWRLSLLAMLCSLGIQITTNLFNDVIDFLKGSDGPERIGPARAAQKGLLSSKQIFSAAFLMILITTLLAIPLVQAGGWPIFILGVTSLFLTYFYTGGPFPLSYTGISEIFVLFFFGVVAVMGVVFLQTGGWPIAALIAGLEIGFFACGFQGINNLRDITADTQANKKTFAVRFGIKAARFEMTLFFLLPYFLNGYWMADSNVIATFLPAASLPITLHLIIKLWKTEPSPLYNRFLWLGAQIQLFFALLLSGGFLWG